MPWVVGIDEAGYGPNLGPLVQAAVCLHLPDADPAGWEALKAVVRRAHEPADGRLLIDDSKKVYTRGGLAALEAVGYALYGVAPGPLGEFLSFGLPGTVEELRTEYWFDPTEQLPVSVSPADLLDAYGRFAECYRSGTKALVLNLVPAPRFNRICDADGSKGAVLARGLVSLLTGVRGVGNVGFEEYVNDPVVIQCDKQGGRNYYAALVQQAFPDGWVVAEVESAAESRYRVEQLARPVTVTFRPRADGDSVAVALASMLCKYLREVCMRQFNRFWATHVPGLTPTAGYPQDAKRYYDAIRPAMAKLGLTADQVWRKK
jgi:ribonuclease HII